MQGREKENILVWNLYNILVAVNVLWTFVLNSYLVHVVNKFLGIDILQMVYMYILNTSSCNEYTTFEEINSTASLKLFSSFLNNYLFVLMWYVEYKSFKSI